MGRPETVCLPLTTIAFDPRWGRPSDSMTDCTAFDPAAAWPSRLARSGGSDSIWRSVARFEYEMKWYPLPAEERGPACAGLAGTVTGDDGSFRKNTSLKMASPRRGPYRLMSAWPRIACWSSPPPSSPNDFDIRTTMPSVSRMVHRGMG